MHAANFLLEIPIQDYLRNYLIYCHQYDLKGKFIMQYPSTGIAAKAIGAKASSHIGECCRGKIKSYKGYIWRYAEDIVSPSSES